MKCPECGAAALVRETRAVPFAYKGRTLNQNALGDWCPSCGEGVLDRAEWSRLDAEAAAFRRAVNRELAAPEGIVAVRKKLKLNQKEAGELFGGGVNAFSRYEHGKATPPQALLVLLRMLDQRPDLLELAKRCAV